MLRPEADCCYVCWLLQGLRKAMALPAVPSDPGRQSCRRHASSLSGLRSCTACALRLPRMSSSCRCSVHHAAARVRPPRAVLRHLCPLPGSVSVSHKAAGTTVTLPAVASTSIGMGVVSSLQRFSRMSASSARPNTAPVWNLLVRRIRGDHVHVADSTIRKVCASPARSAVRLYVAAVAARHAAAHRAKLPLTSQPLPPSSPHSAALVLAKLPGGVFAATQARPHTHNPSATATHALLRVPLGVAAQGVGT